MATADQLAAFNQAIEAGDYATAGSLASAAGYNPEQVAGYLNTSLGMNVSPDVVSGYMPSATVAAPTAEAAAPSSNAGPLPAFVLDPAQPLTTISDYEGTLYDWNAIRTVASQLAPLFDTTRSSGGVYGVSSPSVGFNFDEASRVLGRAPTNAELVLLDMARQLQHQGVTDISQLQQRTYMTPDEIISGEGGDSIRPGYETTGIFAGDRLLSQPAYGPNGFGVTYTGEGGTAYNVGVNPETGQLQFYTTGFDNSDRGLIAPLLAIAAIAGAPYLGSLFGGGTAAAGTVGAGLGPIELAIAAGEGIVPLTAAQTATAGLTAAQLGALGSGIGLSIPAGATATANLLADAEFIAADAAQLAGQTGNNVAAIQQNLIAAGVDPIVAATAADAAALGVTGSNLITTIAEAGAGGAGGAGLFTGGTAADLALGGITTTTGGALPPSTTVPGTTTAPGGTGTPGGGTTAPPGGLPPGITNTLTGLLSNPNTLASLLSLLGGGAALDGGGGGGGGVGTLPTQGIPQNTPEYFNQVQGFLNQYLPGQMPNQAGYLQSWYGSGGNAAMPSAPAPQGNAPAAAPSVVSSIFPGLMSGTPTAAPAPSSSSSGANLLLPPAQAADNPRGVASAAQPSLRELIEASGMSVSDPNALNLAQQVLYGNVGGNLDTRNWEQIMASDNPLAAARDALAAMYSDPAYRVANSEYLATQGIYGPNAGLITYAQMVDRAGAQFTPTAEEAAIIKAELDAMNLPTSRAEYQSLASVLGGTPQVTNQQITDFVSNTLNNPNLSEAEKINMINSAATQYGVSDDRLAYTTGYSLDQVRQFLG